MLASRCVASGNHFNSRAGARLVAACAALGSAQALVAFSGAARQPPRVAAAGGRKGGRALKKGELPTKICAACGLPFEYRSKWAKVWPDGVKYCSERCRRNRASGNGSGAAAGGA